MTKPYGKTLRRARLAAGLSQATVGKKLRVTQVTISNWETGRTTPDEKDRERLKVLLGESVEGHAGDSSTTGSVFGEWLRQARTKKKMTVAELAHASAVSVPQIYNIESGRSSNPRDGTRRRFEKALGAEVPDEVKKEVAQEQEIKGLGPLSDFDPHDDNDLPGCAGVYVFYDISDRPVYVGRGKEISARVKQHSDKFWFKSPIVTHGAYIEIKDESLRNQVEQVLIKFLKSNAVINTQSVERD